MRAVMMMLGLCVAAACGGKGISSQPKPPPGESGPTEKSVPSEPGGTAAGSALPTSDLDRDADGIPDTQDKCPDKAEDVDGFADNDGCPELDNDGDGIPDSADPCPNAVSCPGA